MRRRFMAAASRKQGPVRERLPTRVAGASSILRHSVFSQGLHNICYRTLQLVDITVIRMFRTIPKAVFTGLQRRLMSVSFCVQARGEGLEPPLSRVRPR